jgi:hypothetical protein
MKPHIGIAGARSKQDEEVVQAIISANAGELHIVDARPRLNTWANRVGGAGTEGSHYAHCEIEYLNVENIHQLSASIQRVSKCEFSL